MDTLYSEKHPPSRPPRPSRPVANETPGTSTDAILGYAAGEQQNTPSGHRINDNSTGHRRLSHLSMQSMDTIAGSDFADDAADDDDILENRFFSFSLSLLFSFLVPFTLVVSLHFLCSV